MISLIALPCVCVSVYVKLLSFDPLRFVHLEFGVSRFILHALPVVLCLNQPCDCLPVSNYLCPPVFIVFVLPCWSILLSHVSALYCVCSVPWLCS